MYSYFLSIRGQIGCMGVLLFIAWTYFSVKRRRTTAHKIFTAFLIVSIVNLLFDMITVYTINHVHEIPLGLNHFYHIIYMSSMAASMYIFYLYILNLAYKGFRFRYYQLIPLVVAVVASTVLKFDYVESPYGNYSWGPYATVAFVSAYAYLILSGILLIRNWKHLDLKLRRAIAISMAALLSVAVLQGTFPELLITSIGLTLINLALFYTVESPDALMIEMLAEEREKAESASRTKSMFLAQMSHEIRTPINAILGMNEMILREAETDNIREYSADVNDAGQTLLSLINSILDFSKIEDGKMEIHEVPYQTAALINNLVNSVQDRAKAKGLAFSVEVDERIPAGLIGDDIRLTQVIMNLLTNAVKYTPKGTVTFTIEQEGATDEEVTLFVSVRDTGIGIKPEDRKELFKSFKRLDEEKNRNIEGTGLGLTIVDRLLRMMDSRIEVESEYGKGSVFSFRIRQKLADPTPIGDYRLMLEQTRSAGPRAIAFRAPDARVLIVDDTMMNHKVAKNLLKLYGIVPDLAMSGAECIELMRTKTYDIVCLDHMMPEMDGIETLAKLKEESLIPKETAVLVMTANAVVGAREMYLEKGFTDFIPKPISVEILEEKMKKYLPAELIHPVVSGGADGGERKPGKEQPPETAPEEDVLEFTPDEVMEFNPDGEDAASEETESKEHVVVAASGNAAMMAELDRYGIDVEAGLRHCADDRDFYLELLRDFTDGFEERKKELDSFVLQGELGEYNIRIHSLKSSLRTIGAEKPADEAFALEQASGQNDGSFVHANHAAFMTKCGELAKQIAKTIRNA